MPKCSGCTKQYENKRTFPYSSTKTRVIAEREGPQPNVKPWLPERPHWLLVYLVLRYEKLQKKDEQSPLILRLLLLRFFFGWH